MKRIRKIFSLNVFPVFILFLCGLVTAVFVIRNLPDYSIDSLLGGFIAWTVIFLILAFFINVLLFMIAYILNLIVSVISFLKRIVTL